MPRKYVRVADREKVVEGAEPDVDEVDGVEDDEEVIEEEAPVTQGQLAQTTQQLAKAVQALSDNTVKKVPFSKFKTRSTFNPTGAKRKLTRRVYQNGYPVDVKKISQQEYELLNAIKSGSYINGLVTVSEVRNGGNIDLHIVYANKSPDQRMINKGEWKDFGVLLQRCVDEGRSVQLVGA